MRADVIVVGLGHAGCEAALAAARMGRHVIAVSHNLDKIGLMSCNPAIGGSAKSQLVAELDALGGAMAKAADASGTHFRRLNASRGVAVQANRVVCDRARYAAQMGALIRAQPGIELVQGQVEALELVGGMVRGVRLADGRLLESSATIITTGTFLSGLLHTGDRTVEGGRVGEAPVKGLSADLRRLGLAVGRFKTGTPPRLLAKTVDYTRTERQDGDVPPRPLSRSTSRTTFPALPQLPCFITHTGTATHDLVRANLHRSPLYQGKIVGRGPRYCPSLEDKVVRFASRERHTVFLESEGLESPLVYPAGLSTSLPEDVQLEFLQTIAGLEHVEIAQPGYAVEYDFVPATQLTQSLAVGDTGLFLAGQINGTSGYEEAAVQGLWAGVNAARHVAGEGAWALSRGQAHIAVLVDELVTKPTAEPFRMFTSRSENRLDLREGNADLRLTDLGAAIGLVSAEEAERMRSRAVRIERELKRLDETRVRPDGATLAQLTALGTAPLDKPAALRVLLSRPGMTWEHLEALRPSPNGLTPGDWDEVEARVKYAGYQRRDAAQRGMLAERRDRAIPSDFSFRGLAGLSNEVQEKLSMARPATLADAERISGVTPAALGILAVYIAKHERTCS